MGNALFPQNLTAQRQNDYIEFMHYQEILKSHFMRRATVNPRYSLRAFAGFIELSPSKLSEIWARKKGLSLKRGQEICGRLKLDHDEALLFLTSVEAQHHRDRNVRRKKLEEFEELLKTQNNKQDEKTHQRCAWYFGAVQKLMEVFPHSRNDFAEMLQVAPLQVENAQRFIKRLPLFKKENRKIHLEPLSIFNKIQEEFLFSPNRLHWEADYLFLTSEQLEEMKKELTATIEKFKKNSSKEGHLYLMAQHFIQVTKKETLHV